MADLEDQALVRLISKLGRYPLEAFEFLKDGLAFTVLRLHGEPSEDWQSVVEWMVKHKLSPEQLQSRLERGSLPRDIRKALDAIGGVAALDSRHVSGEQLCWGLRDFALERWGAMARMVLGKWNIRATHDFGMMVFALIDAGLLQKRDDDCIEDFDEVYDFAPSLDGAFRIRMNEVAA